MAAVPPVAAILFDALGTLLRLRPPGPRLRGELAGRFGLEVSEAQAQEAFAAEIRHYRTHLLRGRDAASLAELRADCADVLWAALPQAPEAACELRVEVLLGCLHFDPFPDAAPALRRARAAGRRTVVVSNWDISLHDVLARAELGELLDGVVTSAEVGVAKPAREPFDRALRLAGVEPAGAVHVGDSLREDVAGAQAAGLRAVLLERFAYGERPLADGERPLAVAGAAVLAPGTPRISSLAELDEALER